MELLHQILKRESSSTYPYQTFTVIIKQLAFLHLEDLKYIKLYKNDKTNFFLGHPVCNMNVTITFGKSYPIKTNPFFCYDP